MNFKEIAVFGWLLLATTGCVAKEGVPRTAGEGTCTAGSEDIPNSWSLGGPYSASLMERGAGSTVICVHRDGLVVYKSEEIKMRHDEFVASQTCSYRGRTSTSIFGIGIRSGKEVALRAAWEFDRNAEKLESLEPAQVRCIYSEMDE